MKAYLSKILLVGGLGVGALMGCPANRKGEQVTKPDSFYYYPKANIYYHIPKQEFIYFDSNEHHWRTSRQLPDSLQQGLDKNVMLNDPPLPVWKENEQHRLVYSVSFYASPEDFKEKPPPPQGPVPYPQGEISQGDTTAVPEKREKGIKGFFNRLFGKKEKK
ncbi:hypothetical protein V9K67_18850 [Paraflavisolibacter sp. H34]|uniref:hypothetical protein n=1 Tax=Huijunlia imazamoxiresistens TaxID=3127457 RepID=UPI003015F609